MPPTYVKKRGEGALTYIADTVAEVKKRFRNPYIIISDDFYQWKLEDQMVEFADVREVEVGSTRG